MKTIKQIQDENRKIIILANNPDAKSYDEALEMELGFGCKIICTNSNYRQDWVQRVTTVYDNEVVRTDWDCLKPMKGFNKKDIKIIGKPLTLSRVLIALELSKYRICKNKDKLIFRLDTGFLGQDIIIEWDLTKETLDLQTEETQRAINNLLTGAKNDE